MLQSTFCRFNLHQPICPFSRILLKICENMNSPNSMKMQGIINKCNTNFGNNNVCVGMTRNIHTANIARDSQFNADSSEITLALNMKTLILLLNI